MRVNVVYHYFPLFREKIFDAMSADSCLEFVFIYGKNTRFGVKGICRKEDRIRKNFFIGDCILQTFTFSDLRSVASNDSVILGDVKFINAWIYAAIGRLFKRRIYFWTHGILEPERGLKRFVRKLFYSLSDVLLLYSENERQLLKQSGFSQKTVVIGNSNYSRDDLPETKNPVGAGVFYVGRLTPEKNLKELIGFARANRDIQCKIVGGGTEREKLEQLVTEDQIRNVVITGPIYSIDSLERALVDYGSLVFFSPIGLSAFTGVLLGKRILVKKGLLHKPEYFLLKRYGLVEEFADGDDLKFLLRKRSREEYEISRAAFLGENSSEVVAQRISACVRSQ